MGGMIHPESDYGGLFTKFPSITIRLGDKDSTKTYGGQVRSEITSIVIKVIQQDLIKIGYYCSVSGDFDTKTFWAVRMFNEHFLSRSELGEIQQYDSVDENTANAIKGVLTMINSI